MINLKRDKNLFSVENKIPLNLPNSMADKLIKEKFDDQIASLEISPPNQFGFKKNLVIVS